MKQTSIEWLVDQVEDYIGLIPVDIIEKAKEMHKDEIINSHLKGQLENTTTFGLITVEQKLVLKSKEYYDMLNPMNEKPNDGQLNNPIRPPHYKTADMEVWEMMLAIWGNVAFAKHCEMSAFKYRMRAGKKEDNSAQQDLEKAKWYEEKAREYSDV